MCVCVCVYTHIRTHGASPVGSMVKNLPAIQESQETRVRSLGQEDPLEKGILTYSSIHARRIPRTEEPLGYSPEDWKESDMTVTT